MKKRGFGLRASLDPTHHLYLVLFELFLVAIVFIALMSYVKSLQENTLLEKSYLSKDLALLSTAIYSSPGDVFYVYTHPKIGLQRYNFIFQQGSVIVSDASSYKISYPYGLSPKIKASSISIDKPIGILFSLSDSNLYITASTLEQTISCPDVETKASGDRIVAIDPGHGVDTRLSSPTSASGAGSVFGTLIEQDLTKNIGSALSYQLNQAGVKTIVTSSGDSFVSMQERLSTVSRDDVSLVISLHTGNELPPFNGIRAFIYSSSSKSLQSEKLACLVLKQFALKFPAITSIELNRLDASALEGIDNPMLVLYGDKPSVLIEIGNLQLESGLLKEQSPSIAEPIVKAIQSYYE
ncbi:MAG: N-acetylmuramoyl-L-alanine amidase [Candidatus Woesearchaeota archaeon]